MKKSLLYATLFLSIIIIACSKKNTEDDTPTTADKQGNLLGTGESANDLLSNDTFSTLNLEIAYVKGFKPTTATITDFVSFIKQHSHKTIIDVHYKELASSGKNKLSLDDIDGFEKEHRTAYNNGSNIAMYIYFADAPSDEDNEEEDLVTLGAVFRNTSMVIYEKTIRALSIQSNALTDKDIELATLNHEFAHLFGLVNLGFEDDLTNAKRTNMVNPHEDDTAVNHCSTIGCLMRAELQFVVTNKASQEIATSTLQAECKLSAKSVLAMLHSKSSKNATINVPELGAECVLDLQANGGR